MIGHGRVARGVATILLVAVARPREARGASSAALDPASMPRVGTIDERFQSYNVEMLEVTGGKFWKPYGPGPDTRAPADKAPAAGAETPAGMNPDLYEYRPPIDLTNARLRKLAAGLGPAHVRVSGTWANTTYFPDSDEAPKAPPAGFSGRRRPRPPFLPLACSRRGTC